MSEAKRYGRSKTGIELTESVLNRIVTEAEAGHDVGKAQAAAGTPTDGSAAS